MPDTTDAGPRTLWHYTDFRGLQGILEGKLWASSVAFLNDTREFQYALDVMKELLTEDADEGEASRYEPQGPLGDVIHGSLLGYDGADVYVSSFSENKDDLSQWRAYGGGGGPAVAIGFNYSRLKLIASGNGCELYRVEYDREIVEAECRNILHSLAARAGQSPPATTNPELFRAVSFTAHVVGPLFSLAARSKDASFQGEKEWRLVWRGRKPKSGVLFRQSRSLIVPYVEIPITTANVASVFDGVVVGPTPHPQKLLYAVERMVQAKGLSVQVESSSVPFRNW